MFRRKRSAKDVALLIIDRFFEKIGELPAKTEGIEKIFEPVLKELKRQVESADINWDDVLYIIGAIMYTFMAMYFYDCIHETPQWTCKDLLHRWLKSQMGRTYEWIVRKVVKELDLPIEI